MSSVLNQPRHDHGHPCPLVGVLEQTSHLFTILKSPSLYFTIIAADQPLKSTFTLKKFKGLGKAYTTNNVNIVNIALSRSNPLSIIYQ